MSGCDGCGGTSEFSAPGPGANVRVFVKLNERRMTEVRTLGTACETEVMSRARSVMLHGESTTIVDSAWLAQCKEKHKALRT